MKAVVDRIVQYANRYQLTNVETGEVLGTFDFEEVTGTVHQVGTEIDKELFDSIANDLAARVVSAGGELSGTIVTFSDISGTAANVVSGDTSATLWGKVKNWFSRLKALAFKDKISNTDIADNAAIAQSKVSGLENALASKANDADLAAIAKSGNLADATEDATHRVVTDTEKAAWNGKANTSGTYPDMTVGKANQLVNARQISVDLASSSPASFDGTKDVAAGVTGILPVANGGTGADDLMDIKVGDSAHADTANDPNAVHFTAQTLTDEQRLQARKNISAAAEEQALKNMYNLGAYDTFTDNGDGTVTVTRKTGYLYIDGSQDISRANESGVMWIRNDGGKAATNYANGKTNSTVLSYASPFSGDNRIGVASDGACYARSSANFTTAEACREYFGQNPVSIQYELATSYTEQVIENQPINTLDANMSDIVREEVEKTLNLCPNSTNNFNSYDFSFDAYLEPNKTYTFTCEPLPFSPNSSKLMVNGETIFGYNTMASMKVFTFTAPSDVVSGELTHINFEGNYTSLEHVEFTVMLVEGSHSYPYQPYNGAIVHEKQLDDALEDYLPLTGGMVNGTINATGQVQEAGQRVYSPNNPQTTIAHADNATNIIPDENGAANPLGRKADAEVGSYSTALGYNSTASSICSMALGYNSTASSSYSMALGYNSTASSSYSMALGCGSTASSSYSTALGYNAQVFSTDLHTMQLGSSNLSTLRCRVNLTVTSDKRDKTDIEGITDALAFIERLNPVTFVSNERVDYISDEDKKGETFRMYGMCEYDRIAHAAGTKKGERRRCGLLAQEVIAAMQEVYGTDNYANIVNDNFHDLAEKPSDVENKYTLAYANLVPFLIGAIKGLSAKIKELEVKLMSNKPPLEPFTLTKKP